MERRFRLTRSTDFQRVRGSGKSYAHPLVVLIAAASDEALPRIGVAAGRSVGGAVARNRTKRLLREACRPLLSRLAPGKDIILIARARAASATLVQVSEAVESLLKRADLIDTTYDSSRTSARP